MCDPPSDEQKTAARWQRVRGLGRKLVNRRTLMVAIRIVVMTARLVELFRRLHGDI